MLAALAGCGDGDGGGPGKGGGNGSSACGATLNGSCVSSTGLFCQEYGGLPPASLPSIMESCSGPDGGVADGVWSTGGCTHTSADGACKQEQGGICLALWTYTGLAADFKTQCTMSGGTWVNP